jgi:hypothetical protein
MILSAAVQRLQGQDRQGFLLQTKEFPCFES